MKLILLPTNVEEPSETANFWLKSNYYRPFQQSINLIELCDRGCPRKDKDSPRCLLKKGVNTNSV
ncbi:hypothetical protein ANSO36C_62080 [Nostoc cf. commune SO-36]|uniref:Uncharacterized protein n=1 Tax=Nostoc cf. commune SO-36 TaxID=449208 RepID=A0ABM7ZB00_NOSCO|nr:hypothetical protein [Nostoc commune]BDI20406.1 hypothetical protein ANSO36C_62080 [Nostoc cf. commune SO-36]